MLRNNEDGEKEMNVGGGGGPVCLVEGNGWQRKGNNRQENGSEKQELLKEKKSQHKETAVKVVPSAASWAALYFQFKTILHIF